MSNRLPLELLQNVPNPFNPSTHIVFALPSDGRVGITVYDMLGKQILTLLDEFRSAGDHDLTFDAAGLPSGVYFYRTQHQGRTLVRKMLLMR